MRFETLEISAPISDSFLAQFEKFSSKGFLHFVFAAARAFLLLVPLGLDLYRAS